MVKLREVRGEAGAIEHILNIRAKPSAFRKATTLLFSRG